MNPSIAIAAVLVVATSASAAPVKIAHNSPALEFTYSWPSEAAAIPALDRRFRSESAAAYRRQLTLARSDQKIYREQGRASVSDFYLKNWTTVGRTPRLLSLQYQHSAYTGGAHPNTDYGALLWERRTSRPIPVSALFLRSGALQSLTRSAYCNALDAERLKRRQGETLEGEFGRCPALADLAISPLDKDRNGRFDAIQFVASPYTAGPYAEGAYAIILPVNRGLISAIKPGYRSSFEVQRQ
jgi:peptidoglycan-N-acetylmuramic acid deacetylase PdaC-like protein